MAPSLFPPLSGQFRAPDWSNHLTEISSLLPWANKQRGGWGVEADLFRFLSTSSTSVKPPPPLCAVSHVLMDFMPPLVTSTSTPGLIVLAAGRWSPTLPLQWARNSSGPALHQCISGRLRQAHVGHQKCFFLSNNVHICQSFPILKM